MNLNEARQMAKELKCVVRILTRIDGERNKETIEIDVWYAKRKDILAYKKRHNIGTIEKKYHLNMDDIDWVFHNVKLNRVETCKVVRYKTVHIKAHDSRIPVYECKNGEV